VQQLTRAWIRRRPRKRTVSLFAVATLGVALAAVGGLRVANGATAGVITGYGGECADVGAASSADGTAAQIYTCDGTDAQKWTAEEGHPVNAGSDNCLDTTGPSSKDGAPPQVWTCTDGPNQPSALPTGDATPTVAPMSTVAPPPTVARTTRSSNGFVHPGVLVGPAQLEFVRGRVLAKAQPWSAAYNQMMASRYASLSRNPAPRPVVDCGSHSNPNNGCTDEREDAIAAYTDALAWYITKDARYAQKAIQLMDAWSATITSHTNSNAPLQTGWAGSVWPRAAEIIRYTYTGWANVNRFATMLRTVYLPTVIKGSNSNGNWELSMMEAAVGISVFLNDRTSYNIAVSRYLKRTAAFVYLSSDGALPKTVPGSGLNTRSQIIDYWQGQSTFVTGLTQETCRDFKHTGYGISAISHVAETSRIQGQNLYPQVGERLRQALGFQSRYQRGAAVPSWLCGGSLTLGLGPITEVGYNAVHNRFGFAMTNTQALTQQQRPAGTNNLFVAWETLTHGDNLA
jgi:hypothetical protein